MLVLWKKTNADLVMRDLGRRSIIQKIEDVGDEIAQELKKHVVQNQKGRYATKLEELLRLLDGWHRKTNDGLKAEGVDSCECLTNSGFHVYASGLDFWTIFFHSLR